MKIYPMVSIIVPTKNEDQNIARCLKSIKRQKYSGKIETIVVDNFSSDNTLKLAKKYTKNGFSKGPERSTQRNFGAQIAKGKYLLFIDADMELKPNAVAKCISLISPTRNAPAPTSQMLAGAGGPISLKEHSQGTTFWGKALALERNCYQDVPWLMAARFFPRKEFLKIGGYDPKLIAAEDWDLTLRFTKEGFPTLTTQTPQITHHEPKDSLFKLLQKELYYIKNITQYQTKHPKVFLIQSNPYYRLSIWLRSWQELIFHPILTLAFLWYKFIVWVLWKFNEKIY